MVGSGGGGGGGGDLSHVCMYVCTLSISKHIALVTQMNLKDCKNEMKPKILNINKPLNLYYRSHISESHISFERHISDNNVILIFSCRTKSNRLYQVTRTFVFLYAYK